MSTPPETTPPAPDTEPATEAKPEETTEKPASPPADDEGSDDELPAWAKKKVSSANAEAAKYRTQLRDVEKKLEGAKTQEEFDAAVAELKESNARLERELLTEKVARAHKLPDDLAALMRGSTEAELTECAKTLAKYAPGTEPAPESLSGGVKPDEDGGDGDFNALAEITKYKTGRY